MFVPPADRTLGDAEWRPFVAAQGFGHFIAPGAGLAYPVVVPTQFVLEGEEVLAHFAAANPVLDALATNPLAVLSVAGDWAFVPSDWKVVKDEDPLLGIPTTYYAAVQLRGQARVLSAPAEVAALLERQLGVLQPSTPVARPGQAHARKLAGIRGVVLQIGEVVAKFKYGGNVDDEHRDAVVQRLRQRNRPGDSAAADHATRRASHRRSGP